MENSGSVPSVAAQPVLFVGVGPHALRTLAELPNVVQDWRLRVRGPFGALTLAQPGEEPVTWNGPWLADLEVPGSRDGPARAPRGSEGFPAATARRLCALIRQLRTGESDMTLDSSPRVQVYGYLVVDLSADTLVTAALGLLDQIYDADPSLDMTALAVTGRTAEMPDPAAERWGENFTLLLERLQQANVLQRLYLIDGQNEHNGWLRTPQQLHRMGAEFLLHHGVSPYRDHLRRQEKARMRVEDNFLAYCGSVASRVLKSDLALLAEGVAEELAKDLLGLEEGVLPEGRGDDLDQLAQQIRDEIVAVCRAQEPDDPRNASEPAGAGQEPSGGSCHDRTVHVLRDSLIKACAQHPILGLQSFLNSVKVRLQEAERGSLLAERVRSRYAAVGILQKQVRETYGRTQALLRRPETGWRGPFEPYLMRPSQTLVCSPSDTASYLLGLFVLALGLLGILSADAWASRILAGVAGIAAIGATLLTLLPARWIECHHPDIAEAGLTAEGVPPCRYRRAASSVEFYVAGALTVVGVGLTGVTALASAGAVTDESAWGGAIAFLLAVVAFIFLCWSATHPDGPAGTVGEDEAPGQASLPRWGWHLAGLVCLSAGWGVLCFTVPAPDSGALVARGIGLVLVWAGVALARRPRTGEIELRAEAPQRPPRPRPISPPPPASRLNEEAGRIRAWIEALLAPGAPPVSDPLQWPDPASRGCVLEAIVHQWPRQLAGAFRSTLPLEQGQSWVDAVSTPENWADALLAALDNAPAKTMNLRYLFALHQVKKWMKNMTWPQIIHELHPNEQWLDFFVARSLSIQWPPTRREPHTDVSVITMGEALWDLLGPLAHTAGTHCLKEIRWEDPYMVVAIRIVQGLENGWWRYGGLPGQIPGAPAEEPFEGPVQGKSEP